MQQLQVWLVVLLESHPQIAWETGALEMYKDGYLVLLHPHDQL